MTYVAYHAVSVLVTPSPVEPLTLAEGKLRAGLDWIAGDARDDLMLGFIRAARDTVERLTELAMLTQTRDVYYDVLPSVVTLPSRCAPLQSVISVTSTDAAGAAHVLDPSSYVVDTASARIGLAPGASWPTDLRTFQPWTIRIVAGYTSTATIPPDLLQAMGVLVAHYATTGRDAALAGHMIAEVPFGIVDLLAPFVRVSLV